MDGKQAKFGCALYLLICSLVRSHGLYDVWSGSSQIFKRDR